MTRSILLCSLLALSTAVLADTAGTTPAAAAATATPAATAPATDAAPAAPAAASAVAAAPAAPAKPKLVCETTHPLDSHINQRICMTPEQMAERKKAAQEAMRRLQAGKPCATSGNGC
jgi:hypothetical protein